MMVAFNFRANESYLSYVLAERESLIASVSISILKHTHTQLPFRVCREYKLECPIKATLKHAEIDKKN